MKSNKFRPNYAASLTLLLWWLNEMYPAVHQEEVGEWFWERSWSDPKTKRTYHASPVN